MIRTQKELKREIFNKKASLNEKEIFCSKEYGTFLTQMQQGIGIKKAVKFNSKVVDSNEEYVAFTDGTDTSLNYNNEKMLNGLSKEEKHYFFTGLNLHEVGHLLFTNFMLQSKIFEKLEAGEIYPNIPESTEYLDEVNLFLQNNGSSCLFQLFQFLLNSIEDGFVDRAISSLIPGYAGALKFVSKIDNSLSKDYKTIKNEKLKDEYIFSNMVLSYARHGERIYSEADESDELIKAFKKCEGIIRNAVFEPSPILRAKATWKVFCQLFHFIKVENDKNKTTSGNNMQNKPDNNGQTQNSSGNGNGTSNANQSSLPPSLKDALQNAGSMAPNSEKSKHISKSSGLADKELNDKLKDAIKQGANIKDDGKVPKGNKELDALSEKVAKNKVAKEQEKEITKSLKNDLSKVKSGFHTNVSSNLTRQAATEVGEYRYEAQHDDLDVIVKKFIHTFMDEIKEMQTGDTLTGLHNGKRITSREVYRKDKKIFNRKIAPEDIPDMAVGILIDTSGSMGGERIDMARKCAYVTYKFCRSLEIPVFVIGHSYNSNVNLTSVADELSLDNEDSKRIFSLQTGGCNRDGYALRYCMNKLSTISAEQKLMFVISDGRPNADNYGQEEGRIDCQQVVTEGLKKGIFTVTAGIGDAEGVKYVYKEGVSQKNSASFLDITDLEKLPKTFTKIIKAKLLQ